MKASKTWHEAGLGEGPKLLKYLPDLSQWLGTGDQNQGTSCVLLAPTAALAARDSDKAVDF